MYREVCRQEKISERCDGGWRWGGLSEYILK